MPKQILYSVIKLPASKIYRKIVKIKNADGRKIPKEPLEFNLGDYTYDDALVNNEIVSIGDNLVFHKIREYHGNTKNPLEIYDEIKNIKNEINNVKTKLDSAENRERFSGLSKELTEITFVKDIINVKVENKKHYKKIAMNYFIVNGIRYKRLCAGSGQMRRNTITFVNEALYDYLLESLMCGLNNKIEKITLSKLSAYFALAFSSVLWVRTPRICVIPDFETEIKDQNIDYIFTNEDGKKSIEERTMDLALNSCDGEGLISPECAEWFSADMGLDYTVCQFVVRSAFVKGCLLTFDFKAYAKEVCGISVIKSIYGEEFDIDDIDVLLTESMFKMGKQYKSVKQYNEYHKKYNLKWGVSRYNKKYDDDYSLLNYQYIQNNNLSNENIDALITPTIDWFYKICSGDKLYSLLYALGCKNEFDNFDDIVNSCGSLYTKVIVKNSSLLEDGYIKGKLYQSIKESFRQAKIGRVWAKGGYQFMLSDPIPLIRNALGLDAKGLIPANKVYSAYWNKYNPGEIDLCRSPMVDRHEHNIVTLAQSTEMDKWYKYLYTGIIYSIYDTGTIRASDADFDGDIIYSTNNIYLIRGAYRNNNPITYEKPKAPEKEVTYENIVLCDIDGLDTLVGEITNKSTSITAMLSNFPLDKYPKQHNELLKRLKLLREIIGSEIDKIKLGVSPEFPKEWIERIKVNDTDSDIDKLNHTLVTRDSLFNHLLFGESVYILYEKVKEDKEKQVMLKPLHRDFIKFKGTANGDHVIAFDLEYFNWEVMQDDNDKLITLEPADILKTFPPEFSKAFNAYKNDCNKRWYILNQRTTYSTKYRASLLERHGRSIALPALVDMLFAQEYTESQRSNLRKYSSELVYMEHPAGEKVGTCSLNTKQQKEQLQLFLDATKKQSDRTKGYAPRSTAFGVAPGTKIHRVEVNPALLKDTLKKENNEQISSDLGLGLGSISGNGGAGNYASLQLNIDLVMAEVYQFLEQAEKQYEKLINHILKSDESNYIKFRYLKASNHNRKDTFQRAKDLYTMASGSREYLYATTVDDAETYLDLMELEKLIDYDKKFWLYAKNRG